MTYKSSDGNTFSAHKSDGTIHKFQDSVWGLYYHDMVVTHDEHKGVTFMNTVASNHSSYNNHDYSQVILARRIHKIIWRPSTNEFIKIIKGNLLPNCPIMWADIMAAELKFNPEVGSLKEKPSGAH